MESLIDARSQLDEQLNTLAHVERRRLLAALRHQNGAGDAPIKIDEWGEADTVEALVSMQQQHLPRLDDYGFVEWDREDQRVRKGPRFEEIEPLLELLAKHRD